MKMTQATTVDEPRNGAPCADGPSGASAARLGRSHIAATTNTLFMAHVGASLPALVLLVLAAEPLVLTANREVLALEVVRTLAGSLGIVLAMPITTVIATLMARRGDAVVALSGGWPHMETAWPWHGSLVDSRPHGSHPMPQAPDDQPI